MKKAILISGVVLVLLVVLGVAGYAYAQTQTPYGPGFGTMQGMMGGFGGRGGMMGGWRTGSSGYGPLHTYMVNAMAESLGLTSDELQAQFNAGKTMWEIVQEQGLTEDQFREKMVTARTAAIDQAVSDGVISSEQADWMVDRMDQMWQYGGGEGPCYGGYSDMGRGPGGRWQNPAETPGP